MPPRSTAARPPGLFTLSIPTEAALLWGLLYDLLRAPPYLLLLLLGKARPSAMASPLLRLYRFASAAPMTAILILLNLLVYGWELYARAQGLPDAAFLHRFALSPSDLRAGNTLPLVLHVFAHAGPAHLAGNMVTLLCFGRVVEQRLGPGKLLGAYLLAAGVSTGLSLLAQLVLHQDVPTLGASGAVAGMVALGILFSPFVITFEALLPLPLFLLGWLAMAADLSGVTSGRRDGIDHFAHLGGYLSVLFLYFFLDAAHRRLARLGLLVNVATALFAAAAWLLWLHPGVPRPGGRFIASPGPGEAARQRRAVGAGVSWEQDAAAVAGVGIPPTPTGPCGACLPRSGGGNFSPPVWATIAFMGTSLSCCRGPSAGAGIGLIAGASSLPSLDRPMAPEGIRGHREPGVPLCGRGPGVRQPGPPTRGQAHRCCGPDHRREGRCLRRSGPDHRREGRCLRRSGPDHRREGRCLRRSGPDQGSEGRCLRHFGADQGPSVR